MNASTPLDIQSAPRPFFPALRNAAAVSFLILIGGTFLHVPPLVATLGGLAPLIWYHLFYLRPKAKAGLSQSAIDSVYYFGFLVTIAALGVSAISLASSGQAESMDGIAFQFGLGLMATGYAVFARMHLTSISTWVDEQGPEVVLDRYLKRTQELVTNVEMASFQFSNFANNLMAQSEVITRHATETAEKTILGIAKAFDEQLRATLTSGNHGIAELRAAINQTAFIEEREALARSIKMTLDTLVPLNKALGEFAQRSAEGARSLESSRVASDQLAESIGEFSSRIEEIAGHDGIIVRTARNFEEVQARAVTATAALDGVVGEFTDIGGALGGVGITFKNLKILTTKAQTQLEALVVTSDQLDKATAKMSESALKTNLLSDSMDNVAAIVPKMGETIMALDGQLDKLRITTSIVEKNLQSLPQPAGTAIAVTNELRDSFAGLTKVLASTSTETNSLSANTKRHIENTQKLNEDIGHLQHAGKVVNEMLANISQSATRTNDSLEKTTSTLQIAMQNASGALERDVQTSSRAASLFSEKLSQVAQNIIDSTNRPAPT